MLALPTEGLPLCLVRRENRIGHHHHRSFRFGGSGLEITRRIHIGNLIVIADKSTPPSQDRERKTAHQTVWTDHDFVHLATGPEDFFYGLPERPDETRFRRAQAEGIGHLRSHHFLVIKNKIQDGRLSAQVFPLGPVPLARDKHPIFRFTWAASPEIFVNHEIDQGDARHRRRRQAAVDGRR